jgi:hypothetical protein
LASIDKLNAIPLILEGAWKVKSLPAAILTLIVELRRASFRITNVTLTI